MCSNHQNESHLVARKLLVEMVNYGQWGSTLVDKDKDSKKKEIKSENQSDWVEETEKKKTKLKINCDEVYAGMVLIKFP